MKCSSCGKSYHYHQTETCPYCGAYNQAPAQSNRERDPYQAKAPQKNRTGLYLLAIFGGFAVMGFGIFTIFSANVFGQISEMESFVTAQTSSVSQRAKEQIQPKAEEGTVGALLEELANASDHSSENASSSEDTFQRIPAEEFEFSSKPQFSVSIPEISISIPEISVSVPEISISIPEILPPQTSANTQMVVQRTYDEELLPVAGVALTVTATGTIDLPEITQQLLPGEKAIFISFDAKITDAQRFDQEFFIPPHVSVKKEKVRTLSPYQAAEKCRDLQPLDVDGIRHTEQKSTSGQLIYAIPQDCYLFSLRHSEPDGNISMVTLQV